MTAAVREDRDLARWLACAAVVLGVHAGAATLLARWHTATDGDEGTALVVVDLAPSIAASPSQSRDDIAPGPLQQEQARAIESQPDKPNENTEEKAEPPPPAPDPEIVLPQQSPKTEAKPQEAPTPPAPVATAPPPPRPSAAQVASWHRTIALQLERHKGYPAAARTRHQTGVVQLGFAIDRAGRVVASRIVHSSGVPALDQESLATVKRAQPFPPPPPAMPGQTFDFTVPIRFNIR